MLGPGKPKNNLHDSEYDHEIFILESQIKELELKALSLVGLYEEFLDCISEITTMRHRVNELAAKKSDALKIEEEKNPDNW